MRADIARTARSIVSVPGRVYHGWRSLAPSRLFSLSFAGLIVLGATGFQAIPGLYTGEKLSWLDSLFTSASAVCVTGLIVKDTATFFTPFGQAYVLLLIQLGGLGIITFATWIMLSLGQRMSLRQQHLSLDSGVAIRVEPTVLIRDVLRFTLIIEGIGALLLWVLFIPRFGFSGGAWHAVFHSISAFCNAGFSTFTTSLIQFQSNPAVLIVLMGLIVVGGLGFLTMTELRLTSVSRRNYRRLSQSGGGRPEGPRPPRLTVHTRLVLATTAALIASGWVLFSLLEWNVSLGSLGVLDRLANAFVMSVTPRTAGFNSIDYADASDGANFLTILLMTIGGSPGSTAGGLKTTTFALIVLLAWARLRGRDSVEIANRTIPDRTVQRAIGLTVLVFVVLTASVFLLSATEIGSVSHRESGGVFIAVLFEAVSALNTVGLSMGITADLTPFGRWVMILLMYVGRVGPMTLAASLSRSQRSPHDVRLAQQDVLIG